MGFLDELTAVLRDPPAPPEPPPEGALDRWHREVLAGAIRSTSLSDEVEGWLSRVEARRRLGELWAAACELSVLSMDERVGLVEEALARFVGSRGPVAHVSPFVERHIATMVERLEEQRRPDPLDPVRYLAEVGALDGARGRRTAFGDLLLELRPRDRVVALLHAEVAQSMGWDDTYRVPAASFRLALAARAWSDHPDDPDYAPIAFGRLDALGVIEGDSTGGPTTWRLVADRSSWLEDVVAEPVSPLGQLVRGALADQRLRAAGGGGSSVQSALREFAELVTHELRNVVLSMRLDVGQLGGELGGQHKALGRIERSIKRLEAFVTKVESLHPVGA